jgi:hypothetical protein
MKKMSEKTVSCFCPFKHAKTRLIFYVVTYPFRKLLCAASAVPLRISAQRLPERVVLCPRRGRIHAACGRRRRQQVGQEAAESQRAVGPPAAAAPEPQQRPGQLPGDPGLFPEAAGQPAEPGPAPGPGRAQAAPHAGAAACGGGPTPHGG